MLKCRVSALALVACIAPGTLWAQSCIAPGAIVTINAAGIDLDFSDGSPGIVLAHTQGRTRARVLGQVGDQLTFQVPLTGLPPGSRSRDLRSESDRRGSDSSWRRDRRPGWPRCNRPHTCATTCARASARCRTSCSPSSGARTFAGRRAWSGRRAFGSGPGLCAS
jgi:hypothetical protein